MSPNTLTIHRSPELNKSRMILGFSGWMDGGQVSTGSIEYLANHLNAEPVANIDPEPYYLYSFPGPMEVSAAFRPHTRIEDGVITALDGPEAEFVAADEERLILFSGREPNMQWSQFADDVFQVAEKFDVDRLCFVGSVSGLLPHTREPLFWSTASSPAVRQAVQDQGLTPTNYEGPAGFATYLVQRAQELHLPMATVVVGVPPYVQGRNYQCIQAVLEKVNGILELDLDLSGLDKRSREFVRRLDSALDKRPEFAEQVRKLEQHYDQELQGAQDNELKNWFDNQDIEIE
jgi:predicted ATP-grasp superfamily ATP-dependent carboligase